MDTSRITHGLIIDTPWIDDIRKGRKTWELRSTSCSKRGPIALIQKGSKRVVAIADLVDASGPLSVDTLRETFCYHQVPESRFTQADFKWFYAWKLASITPLDNPTPYIHKNGAVIWVELDERARQQLALINASIPLVSIGQDPSDLKEQQPIKNEETLLVPMARDGSIFCPQLCKRNGVYTVGSKGDERRFSNFSEALDYLKGMPTARWRRPNSQGNWGIVSAVEWTD